MPQSGIVIFCPCDLNTNARPSTPFVTGRPYTHIFNGSMKSSGAVGLALSGCPRTVAQTAARDLRAITKPLKVTQDIPPPIVY
ncbi:hypothetical protein V8E53_014225 [Lactarius tabidus]